eukprot:gnl/Dysnectes_brevis/1456_a1647_2184.p1 GENE.gnl/Dysnectes_brevis/1456_a1647_2184~~gnl/Dysnectes_brevis/1456_a1647_2184.p1  ORF type:complete len:450 (+),score=130.38 gnl/Dysnectes_brevis/1456_a1647_2184:34-1350(+)
MGQDFSKMDLGKGGKRKKPPKKFKRPGPPPTRTKKKRRGPGLQDKIPDFAPHTRCRLRLLKASRIHDMLQLEREFITRRKTTTSYRQSDQAQRSMIDRLRGRTQSVATLQEMVDDSHCIVSRSLGPSLYTRILSFVDQDLLDPGTRVLLHEDNHRHVVVGVLQEDEDPMVSVMKVDKAPAETYADIGGLEEQIREIKESVELPLTRPELYEDVGIIPPKGVILYGPPGTGKTLLAKAVASSTKAAFLRITGSELIQKYSGEGPRLVRELFKAAEDMAPTIIFIDEIDAVGSKRYDASSGGEREVQRTMLELLNQLDGFDSHTDVKVILATNRMEALDQALIRPGRIDRKIEFPLPDFPTKQRIFRIHTSKMTLSEDVDINELAHTRRDLSGADIKAICTEAGLLALRERRMKVTMVDFTKARGKVLYKKQEDIPDLYS